MPNHRSTIWGRKEPYQSIMGVTRLVLRKGCLKTLTNTQILMMPFLFYLQFKSTLTVSQLLNCFSQFFTHINPQTTRQCKLQGKFQKLWQETVRNMDLRVFNQEKHCLFVCLVLFFLTDSFSPLLEESGTLIPRTGPGYRRSQRLFLKRSLRHVENICIAQQGLKSEPQASISLPCKFFKANKLKCKPDNCGVSFYSPHSAAGYR